MSKILIIEDSEMLLNFLRDIFMREGYAVFTAPTGAEGLTLFDRHRPDLTLLGVHVRRPDGWAVFDALVRKAPQASLVLLASAASEEAKKRAAESACIGLVSKEIGLEPFLHDLKRTVTRILPPLNAAPRPERRGRLLVVDDDPQIRALLSRLLKAKDFEVLTARNGEEAISLVKKERPHLMLLDIDMPGMGGMDVLKEVRRFDKELIVIMITGGDTVAAEETIKQGAGDYIMKPFNIHYLETTVMTKILNMTS